MSDSCHMCTNDKDAIMADGLFLIIGQFEVILFNIYEYFTLLLYMNTLTFSKMTIIPALKKTKNSHGIHVQFQLRILIYLRVGVMKKNTRVLCRTRHKRTKI